MATGPAEEVSTTADTQEIQAVQSKAPSDEVKGYEKWRLGGYGEMLAAFKDYGLNRYYGGSKGNTKKNHHEISIPRFVLEGEYKINPKWILSAEIEFESGGTGITYEIESQSGSENGEYETEVEKGGEVALEQMITSGLNPNGFDCYNWVKKAKQGFLEVDNFTAPAYTARLNWTGVPGLRLGASFFYNPKAQKNADKLITYAEYDDVNVLLYSFDAQYVNQYVTARANYLSGNITETIGVTAANRRYSSKSPYSRMGPVARRAVDWSAEVGVNLKSFFPHVNAFPVVYPFVHYNYYNPQETCEDGLIGDNRCQVSLWSFGLNWRPLSNLVVKADYTTRQIGTGKMFGSGPYNSENEFRIGIAYQLWFARK